LRHQARGVFASVRMIFQASIGLLFQVYDWADAGSDIKACIVGYQDTSGNEFVKIRQHLIRFGFAA